MARKPKPPRIDVQVDDLMPFARDIFKYAKCSQPDELFWKMAALGAADLVAQADVIHAAQAASTANNKAAYFLVAMREKLAAKGQSLTALLKRVRIRPRCPSKLPPADVHYACVARVVKQMTALAREFNTETAGWN